MWCGAGVEKVKDYKVVCACMQCTSYHHHLLDPVHAKRIHAHPGEIEK